MSQIKAFTLVEILVIMAIISAVALITYNGLIGLRRTQEVYQARQTMFQDVRLSRQKAMLLEKSTYETVYGYGIDLREYNNGHYFIFKFGQPKDPTDPAFTPIFPENYDPGDYQIIEKEEVFTEKPDNWTLTAKCGAENINYLIFEGVNGNIHTYTAAGSCPVDHDINISFKAENEVPQYLIIKTYDGDIYLDRDLSSVD